MGRIGSLHDGYCSIWDWGGNIPVVLEDEMSYQKSTGTLSPGAHAGSYNGQDAYNDMLVTEDVLRISSNRAVQGINCGICSENERLQRCNGLGARGGWRHE